MHIIQVKKEAVNTESLFMLDIVITQPLENQPASHSVMD